MGDTLLDEEPLNDSGGDVIDDGGGGDVISEEPINNDDELIEEPLIEGNYPVIESRIRDIRLRRNQTIDNLLFAIGDDFGVTEEGILYARESYIKNGLFTQLICKNLVVDTNAVVSKDLTVEGNLVVKGKVYVQQELASPNIKASDMTVSGDLKGHNLFGNKLCVHDDADLYISKYGNYSSDSDDNYTIGFLQIYNKVHQMDNSGEINLDGDVLNG